VFVLGTKSWRWLLLGTFLAPEARSLAVEAGPIVGALAGGFGLSDHLRVTQAPIVLLIAVPLNE
jgi:hypothetical protein